MSQADRIRQSVLDAYVTPARSEGRPDVTVRAGDVHQAMGLSNALPAVCSAIGGRKFEDLAGVVPADRTGPANGSNVYFSFTVMTEAPSASTRPGPAAAVSRSTRPVERSTPSISSTPPIRP